MTTTPTPEWETFSDPSYYDMWCVRQVGQRTFGEGFHLIQGEEAQALCDFLNTRTAPTPEPVARQLEVEALVEAAKEVIAVGEDVPCTDCQASANALRAALAQMGEG